MEYKIRLAKMKVLLEDKREAVRNKYGGIEDYNLDTNLKTRLEMYRDAFTKEEIDFKKEEEVKKKIKKRNIKRNKSKYIPENIYHIADKYYKADKNGCLVRHDVFTEENRITKTPNFRKKTKEDEIVEDITNVKEIIRNSKPARESL